MLTLKIRYSNYDVPTPSSIDENCYPSPESGHHMEHSSSFESSVGQVEHHNYSNTVSSIYSSVGESMFSLQSPASSEMSTSKENHMTFRLPSPCERISPAPSLASDMTSSSSPYDNQPSMVETSAVSRTTISGGHEDELFDFSSWFWAVLPEIVWGECKVRVQGKQVVEEGSMTGKGCSTWCTTTNAHLRQVACSRPNDQHCCPVTLHKGSVWWMAQRQSLANLCNLLDYSFRFLPFHHLLNHSFFSVVIQLGRTSCARIDCLKFIQ